MPWERWDIGVFDTIEEARAFIKSELERGTILPEPEPAIAELPHGRFVVMATAWMEDFVPPGPAEPPG